MNVTTSYNGGTVVLRVDETRLTYPILADFAAAATGLIAKGEKRIVLDLSSVTYVDSATIGCLMDLYRQATAAGGTMKLAGVQKRVETMLTMTGAHHFLEVYADEPSALASFKGES
jgi:anti-sigma B factor antagonist